VEFSSRIFSSNKLKHKVERGEEGLKILLPPSIFEFNGQQKK